MVLLIDALVLFQLTKTPHLGESYNLRQVRQLRQVWTIFCQQYVFTKNACIFFAICSQNTNPKINNKF